MIVEVGATSSAKGQPSITHPHCQLCGMAHRYQDGELTLMDDDFDFNEKVIDFGEAHHLIQKLRDAEAEIPLITDSDLEKRREAWSRVKQLRKKIEEEWPPQSRPLPPKET